MDEPNHASDATHEQPNNQSQSLKILVLSGLVGSGKSTFASELEKFHPNFVRISQDVLGSRPACVSMAQDCLKQGKSVVIDRQNFDRKQRKTWVELGQEFSTSASPTNAEIYSIEFATPYEECAQRLQVRTDHETLHSVNEAMGILKLGLKNWRAPEISEGFKKLLVVVPKGTRRGQDKKSIGISFPVTEQCIKSILDQLV